MKNVCLRLLRNPFRISWSSLCKLRRVITSMLAMRRNLLRWQLKLTPEKVSQDPSKWGRAKTLMPVLTRKRALLLLEKAPRNQAPRLMMKAWKIRWLLCWRRSMISHASLNSRKMISNHIQMLNLSSTSSSMMSRLKFWKWNEIFGLGLIKFKVAKSELQETGLNLQTSKKTKNEFSNDSIFDQPSLIQTSKNSCGLGQYK